MTIATALAGRITLNSNRLAPTRADNSSSATDRGNSRHVNHTPPAAATLTDSSSPQQTCSDDCASAPPPQTGKSTDTSDATLHEHFQRGLG
eukprot:6176075-Pleurochrysis_carterae.AAC.1